MVQSKSIMTSLAYRTAHSFMVLASQQNTGRRHLFTQCISITVLSAWSRDTHHLRHTIKPDLISNTLKYSDLMCASNVPAIAVLSWIGTTSAVSFWGKQLPTKTLYTWIWIQALSNRAIMPPLTKRGTCSPVINLQPNFCMILAWKRNIFQFHRPGLFWVIRSLLRALRHLRQCRGLPLVRYHTNMTSGLYLLVPG
jgi:hypothetical protein